MCKSVNVIHHKKSLRRQRNDWGQVKLIGIAQNKRKQKSLRKSPKTHIQTQARKHLHTDDSHKNAKTERTCKRLE